MPLYANENFTNTEKVAALNEYSQPNEQVSSIDIPSPNKDIADTSHEQKFENLVTSQPVSTVIPQSRKSEVCL